MYQNIYDGKQYYPKLNIELEPGVYLFSLDSGTGKTYTRRVLNDVARYRDTLAYSYEDYICGRTLEEELKRVGGNPKVLLLDRYDIYVNEYHSIVNVVNALSESTIILVDLKNPDRLPFNYDDLAFIDLTEGEIDIYSIN